jgi:ribosomal protein L40E
MPIDAIEAALVCSRCGARNAQIRVAAHNARMGLKG